jgi:hypothetical protein
MKVCAITKVLQSTPVCEIGIESTMKGLLLISPARYYEQSNGNRLLK